MNNYDLSLDFKSTPENEKAIKELLNAKGLTHYLLKTKNNEELDLVEYKDYQKLENKIKEAIDYITYYLLYNDRYKDSQKQFNRLLKILERTDK